jgi:glycosyltransferase involved in cell wall biosynthesis
VKLLILTPSFARVSPVAGALALLRHAHLRADDVEVVFGALASPYSKSDSVEKELEQLGVRSVCFRLEGLLGLRSWRRVEDFARKERVDGILSLLLRPDLVTGLQRHALRVMSVRGHCREDYGIRYGTFRGGRAWELHRWALRRADRVFAMSGNMARWLESEGVSSSAISVHHNFLDTDETLARAALALEEGPRIEVDRINVGWFGSLIDRKRPDIAIAATCLAVHDHGLKELKLHVVGGGPLRPILERQTAHLGMAEHVRFHGHLENPLGLMASMQMVISTSRSEGTSRSLMEALTLGRTVVASDIPGIEELIREGETGYLVPFGDAATLASRLASLAHPGGLLAADSLLSFIRRDFDVVRCADGMLSDVRNCLTRTQA